LLLHSMTTLYAQTNLDARPERVPGYMKTEYEPGKARLIDMLKHFEIAAPLERFDEALLMTADKLGLRHVQYARVDPECDRSRPQRVLLDDPADCTAFSERVRRCSSRRKGCAPQHQAACEEVVRRIAPLDFWLYERVRARFQRRLDALGPSFAARVKAFQGVKVGVWTGGAPVKPSCRFKRRANATIPSFERDPCRALQQPQAIGEAVWLDRSFTRAAQIIPVPDRRRAKRRSRRV